MSHPENVGITCARDIQHHDPQHDAAQDVRIQVRHTALANTAAALLHVISSQNSHHVLLCAHVDMHHRVSCGNVTNHNVLPSTHTLNRVKK
jgi:hypothetical protein